MAEIKDKEITALITLLDDNDSEIYTHVADKLKAFGPSIIPTLEDAWGDAYNAVLNERIEDLIHRIQFDSLSAEFKNWAETEERDLLFGAFLMAKFIYPDLEYETIRAQVDKIKKSIWLELNYDLTPFEQINIFNQIFYSLHNIKGEQTPETDERDLCINHVLTSRHGTNISTGILYLIVAQQLDIPAYGVDLPKHFVLGYTKDYLENIPEDQLEKKVMFYINPMNKGAIFTRNEIKEYLNGMDFEHDTKHFIPAQNIEVMKLLIKSFILHYQKKQDFIRSEELEQLLHLIS